MYWACLRSRVPASTPHSYRIPSVSSDSYRKKLQIKTNIKKNVLNNYIYILIYIRLGRWEFPRCPFHFLFHRGPHMSGWMQTSFHARVYSLDFVTLEPKAPHAPRAPDNIQHPPTHRPPRPGRSVRGIWSENQIHHLPQRPKLNTRTKYLNK